MTINRQNRLQQIRNLMPAALCQVAAPLALSFICWLDGQGNSAAQFPNHCRLPHHWLRCSSRRGWAYRTAVVALQGGGEAVGAAACLPCDWHWLRSAGDGWSLVVALPRCEQVNIHQHRCCQPVELSLAAAGSRQFNLELPTRALGSFGWIWMFLPCEIVGRPAVQSLPAV